MKKILAVCIGSITLALASCSSSGDENAVPGTSNGADRSWVKSYDTIAQLGADTKVVVKGTVVGKPKAVSADEEGISRSKSNLYRVRVTSVAAGKGIATGQTITVRGDAPINAADQASGDFAVLKTSSTYLLYLTPFEFKRGISTGQYTIVGQEAAYRDIGGGKLQRITTRDRLPLNTSESGLVAATRSTIKS